MPGRCTPALRTAAIALAAFIVAPAVAHDFWIDLPSYRTRPGAIVPVRFLVGDAGEVAPWETAWRRIVSLRLYGPDGAIDAQAGIRPTVAGDPGGASLVAPTAGSYILALETNHAESDLSAADFDAYAAHEGLTAAIAARRGGGGKRGRELYSRRAKAILQVGGRHTANVTRPIGQTLEIVPEADPATLGRGAGLPVRILYHGHPLPGASVVAEAIGARDHAAPIVTDGAGRALVALPLRGRWRIGVVWTQPIEHPRADWETVFATLTFET